MAQSSTAAQALFDEGRRLMQAGDYAAACPKLAESQRLDPGAGTLLNLASCYEKREQLASAWVTYTEAASDAARSNRPEWEKKAKEKSAALQPVLSTLTINAKSGVEVLRDGQAVSAAELGVKVPIDGGDHIIEARAPDREPWSTHVKAPAKHGALTVTVPELVTKVTKATKPTVIPVVATNDPAPVGRTQRTIGVVLGIAGVAGLGLGGIFTGVAVSHHNEAKGNCTADESLCNPAGRESYAAAGDAANVATVAFIAGAVLLAGGVVLYLTAPRGTKPSTAAWNAGRGWTF